MRAWSLGLFVAAALVFVPLRILLHVDEPSPGSSREHLHAGGARPILAGSEPAVSDRWREPAAEEGSLPPSEARVPEVQVKEVRVRRHVANQAMALFRQLDHNGDGLLNDDELSPTLRAQRDRWDGDQDGLIDPTEFLAYFSSRVEQFRAERGIVEADAPQGFRSVTADGPEAERQPAWFRTMDTDNDGQIGLYEWQTAGRSVEAFRRLDRNGDGFVTAKEVRTSLASARSALPASLLTNRESDPEGGPSPLDGWSVNQSLAPVRSSTKSSRSSAAAPKDAPAPSPRVRQPALRTTADQLERRHVQAAATPFPPPAPVARVPVVIPQPVAPPTPAPPPTAPLGGDVLATLPLPLDGGSSAYWRQRNTENEIRLLQGGHANVLFLGDSITDSLSSGPGKPIWDMFFDPLDMDNFAVGGISTSQVLWQVETGQVALASPEVVVLMIGTNNLGLGQSPKAVAAGISKIVDELGQQLPHTQVLLLGILPRGQSPADPARQQIAQVNRLIAGLDDGRRVRFLDLGGGFVQPDGTISPAVMPDFLHPSLLGYQIYTISVWQPLMELLFWK